MSRVTGLWPILTSAPHLFAAARTAARRKRKRPGVAAFLLNLETEVFALRRDLIDGTWHPGPYRTFTVADPKPRVISAAPFRDRVVHHALTSLIEPPFERRFIRDSYACRTGYGTHRALDRARAACRTFPYVLKCDVARYFPSIDHEILLKQLARVIACDATLDLAARIVGGFALPAALRADPVYFPGDSLFTPAERPRGLPLGNQTSQFFANVYLNPFDHFVVRRLQPGCYVRYVDDLLLFGRDPRSLARQREAIEEWLSRLRLVVHLRKTRVFRVRDGVTFLGWRLFGDRTRLVRPAVDRFRRRLRWMQRQYAARRLDQPAIRQRLHAWLGHASWGDTWQLRQSLLGPAIFVRGARP
jgi:retron-type reverse transcriptase